MKFDLNPHEGPAPLHLGMNELDIKNIIGEPIRIGKNWKGERTLYFPDLQVNLGNSNKLLEVMLYPSAGLHYRGLNIFDCHNISDLRAIDSAILEYMGILLLPNAGITASGFHNEEERTITVLSREAISPLLPKFKEINQ